MGDIFMRIIFTSILAILFVSMSAMAQVDIDTFDWVHPDSALTHAIEGDLSSFVITQNTSDKVEGTSSIEVKTTIGAYHPWGSYATFGDTNGGSVTQDWSESDSLSLWIKVKAAPKQPEYMVLRIQIADKPTADDPSEEYIYENTSIIDATTGWINLRVPLIEREQDAGGTLVPDSTGFILVPTSWGGFTYNNHKLDRDKIHHWTIGIITTGWTDPANIPADSVDILFDNFARFGIREFPVTLFNGKAFTPPVTSSWAWGAGSSIAVIEGAGDVPKSNAIKFVESSEWGGWGGWGVDMASTNMKGAWPIDTFHVTIKAEAGGDDTLRAQFESASGKRAIKFAVTRDNEWHDYAFALKDMLFDDGSPDFDTSAVTKFGIMENGNNTTGGQVDYFTNIWTGNPVFDVIPPEPPTNLSVTKDSYSNLISWTDVPTEANGGRYNVFWDYKTWTSPDSPSVKEVAPYDVPQGDQLQTHLLRSPVTDQDVTVYYGVVAKDAAGNVSEPVFAGSTTNLAKGVPIIAKATPNFTADANLTEWNSIAPFSIAVSTGSEIAPNGTIDGDNDCSAKGYIAMDNDNLYVAFDVTDDVVNSDSTLANNWENDAVDLFIGLYDSKAKTHSGLASGANADYHFRFASNRILIDNAGGATVYYNNTPNYIWKKNTLTAGYKIEAKIPFARLSTVVSGNGTFVPASGMTIPIDIEIMDRDNLTTSDYRDCKLCYSTMNKDLSYQDMWRWTYTWYDATTLGVQKNPTSAVVSYDLSQNFPNPFNPTTEIHFSLAKAGYTNLTVYDVLGREVATLVDGFQAVGNHTITFNASHFASGMYLYRIQSGSYIAVKKMLLMK